MKKKFRFFVLPGLILFFVFLFPFCNTVVVHKDKVDGIYCFAGKIDQGNGKEYVTLEVCTEYWLERDEQPDLRYVRSCRLGLLGLVFGLGFTY